MEGRSLEQLRAGRADWDRDASRTAGIDRWCTRIPWMLGVHTAFSRGTDAADEPVPDDDPTGLVGDVAVGAGEGAQVAFARRRLEDGSEALLPFDATWAFGSPVVSSASDPLALTRACRDAAAWLVADPHWRLLACSGVTEASLLDHALIGAFATHARVLAGPTTDRCVASLNGGIEGWESRRTREFRRNLRQARRRADDAGFTVQVADALAPFHVIARLHGVERASWKGIEGSGIESPSMAALYAGLVHDLSATGSLRCAFAQLDGRDVGFVLGGVLGDTYRGLQISFAQAVRALGIGNLLQAHEVERLCAAGVERYDLGMDIPYKRNWGEQIVTTRTLLVVR